MLDAVAHRHGKLIAAELEAHFDAAFLAKVPVEQLSAVLEGFAQRGDIAIADDVKDSGTSLVAHATIGDDHLRVSIAVEPTSGKIVGLLFRPDLAPGPTSYADAQHALAALAPHAQFLVAALDHGACKPLHAFASSDELALGSAFKLYVLLGLADRMIAGTSHWTDEPAVRDEWKSLPSGITQNDAAGTKMSIQTFAERMISISDNTATDHLLYTVGRKSVEAALREAKHSKPALDIPFPGTRELFILKLGAAAEMAKYIALPEAGRRKMLDVAFAGKAPRLADADGWKTARAIDKLEWFASSEDLCRVMGTLWTRAQDPKAAPLLDVLAKNPGLPIDTKQWPYVGFKGGSEPGVLDLTYLLRRADDKWFVVTVGANSDEGGTVDENQLLPIVGGLIDLAAKEP